MLRPNIDARGASARRTMGAAALLLGAALAGWLLQSSATPWAMLLLLPVFAANRAIGFFQARAAPASTTPPGASAIWEAESSR